LAAIDTPVVDRASCRRERLSETLERLRREKTAASVVIPVPRDVFDRKLTELPAGVDLKPGRLSVEYEKTLDLLQKLFVLAQAIANDFENFQTMAEGVGS